MLPRKLISYWLHRYLPAHCEGILMQASWTCVRHQLSAHGSCGCIFLFSLFVNDDRKIYFLHQPGSQASQYLSQLALLTPQSLPKLLVEKVELPQQPICTFDLWCRLKKNPKPWSKLQHKILSINPPCTAEIFVVKICKDCSIPNLPRFLPQELPARMGASRPVSL